ncbi:hypothetical protein PVK06_017161 [Gossypium arboreum]|uniref:Uncharacterized protein n=1 Tax=Gossypium arboreum TaxID=29729 RepID=A0ABR0Q272_GOSAR|nr:hypothetical protein PVK06_017161 [Gossypium arboreum]
MVRARGSGLIIQGVSSQCREVNAPVEAKAYVCTTKEEEMSCVLVAWGIQIPNFAYDFSIIEGSNRLSDTIDRSFLLSFHMLEAGDSESGATPFMITVGADNTLVGDAGDTFVSIFYHGPLEGSMRFMSTSGETQMLFLWREHLSMQKILYFPIEDLKKVEFENFHQSIMGALKRAYELHRKLDEENRKLVEQNKRVNFNALNNLIDAQFDFDVHFPFGATWKKFVEE